MIRHASGSRILALVCALGVATLAGGPQAQSLEEREKALEAREAALQKRERELALKSRGALPAVSAAVPEGDVLPEAKPGQCFAKVLAPAVYETVEERVIAREKSARIEIIPWPVAAPIYPLEHIDELSVYGYRPGDCPQAEALAAGLVGLPTHTRITPAIRRRIIHFLQERP